MNALPRLLADNLPQKHPLDRPGLLALIGPHAASQAMLTLAAHLSMRGPLRVLDGGNRFNAYIVARLLRHLGAQDLIEPLSRIQVSRAFTCYQMTALIEDTSPGEHPTLVIDFLDTFYDESASLEERRRLAWGCMAMLRRMRLAQSGPGNLIVLSLRPPPPPHTDPTGLLDIVQTAVDAVLYQDDETVQQARAAFQEASSDASPCLQPKLF